MTPRLRPTRALAAALLAAALLAGCGGGGDGGVKTFTEPGSIRVHAGDEFRIALAENPSTGYLWRFARRPEPRVVRYLGSDFELEEGGEDRDGAGGTRLLRFRAVARGRTTMALRNVFTGGERGREPVDERGLEVVVD